VPRKPEGFLISIKRRAGKKGKRKKKRNREIMDFKFPSKRGGKKNQIGSTCPRPGWCWQGPVQ